MDGANEGMVLRGARLDPPGLRRLMDHVFETNLQAQAAGEAGTPLCIWGAHGVGKTAIVEGYARDRGWGFAYCAPAQFEEMGDLHGLPTTRGEGPDARTHFAPPAWVPEGEGPGILLLDDLNRADDRILRGLMQLLQTRAMFSWGLPPRWQIVCTANPEGGDYSVTPMDDAMLSRLLHASLVFDPKAWAAWATSAGVDPRGVAFVLTYPEVLARTGTTARSLTQLFEQLKPIDDLRASLELVETLARSSLDEVTTLAFTAFVMDGLEALIDPSAILDAEDFGPIADRLRELAEGEGDGKRVDRLATIATRLYLHVGAPGYEPTERHRANLVAFLLHDALPEDLRVGLHRDLSAHPAESVRGLVRDPQLAAALLDAM
jgi:MoxR-like ATPase